MVNGIAYVFLDLKLLGVLNRGKKYNGLL